MNKFQEIEDYLKELISDYMDEDLSEWLEHNEFPLVETRFDFPYITCPINLILQVVRKFDSSISSLSQCSDDEVMLYLNKGE